MKIQLDDAHQVSALLTAPATPASCLVLAHGAGAGMTHPFLTAVAEGLHARRIATLRFQFPSMEAGSKRPDRPPLAKATVRAAVKAVRARLPGVPVFAGGKSFGGRMTSQAQAEEAMPGVVGLVFLGFPLHPAGKPASDRADHLAQISVPMLFLQGTRDALADMALLKPATGRLGDWATLVLLDQADHAFHVPVRSGRTDAEILAEMLDRAADWMLAVAVRSA